MSEVGGLMVTDKNGRRGQIQPGETRPVEGVPCVRIFLENGREVLAPYEALVERQGGGYFLPFSLTELAQPAEELKLPDSEPDLEPEPQTVVAPARAPAVGPKAEAAEGARVVKSVQEREEVVDEWLLQESANFELVPVNRPVDEPAAVRFEGETLIIPLHEEVLVVGKQLMLRHELRVTRRQTPSRHEQTVTLRREAAAVEDEEGRVLDLES